MNDPFEFDLGDDLEIIKTTRRASGGGTWVSGKIAGPPRAQPSSNKLARVRITETAETVGLGDFELLSVPPKRKQPATKPARVRLTHLRA